MKHPRQMKYIKHHSDTLITWFRIFGYGLCFRNTRNENFELSFSERQGLSKYYQIFGYVVTILKPNK